MARAFEPRLKTNTALAAQATQDAGATQIAASATAVQVTQDAEETRLAAEQQSGALGRIVGELMSFVDTDNNAGQSGFLLKSMTDVTITEG